MPPFRSKDIEHHQWKGRADDHLGLKPIFLVLQAMVQVKSNIRTDTAITWDNPALLKSSSISSGILDVYPMSIPAITDDSLGAEIYPEF